MMSTDFATRIHSLQNCFVVKLIDFVGIYSICYWQTYRAIV